MSITVGDLDGYAERLHDTHKTKTARRTLTKTILNGVTVDTPIAGDDLAVVLGILAGHPSAAEKVGVGITSIHVELGYMGTKGFHITRTDGSTTDFSYLKCLRPDSAKGAVERGCRAAVHADIVLFRTNWEWTDGCCHLTGLPIKSDDAEVHHAPPMFDRLVQAWVATRGGFEVVGDRMQGGDNLIGDLLSYDDTESWLDYHRTHAVLMVVHKTANASIEAARRSIKKAG